MKTSRKITLAILISTKLLIAASSVHAQDLMNIAVNAMNNARNARQYATLNDELSQMIWANAHDPYVQQAFVQQVNAGLFYDSIKEFPDKWIVTGGMSDAGYARAMGLNSQIDQQHQTMLNGYWDSMGKYQGA